MGFENAERKQASHQGEKSAVQFAEYQGTFAPHAGFARGDASNKSDVPKATQDAHGFTFHASDTGVPKSLEGSTDKPNPGTVIPKPLEGSTDKPNPGTVIPKPLEGSTEKPTTGTVIPKPLEGSTEKPNPGTVIPKPLEGSAERATPGTVIPKPLEGSADKPKAASDAVQTDADKPKEGSDAAPRSGEGKEKSEPATPRDGAQATEASKASEVHTRTKNPDGTEEVVHRSPTFHSKVRVDERGVINGYIYDPVNHRGKSLHRQPDGSIRETPFTHVPYNN